MNPSPCGYLQENRGGTSQGAVSGFTSPFGWGSLRPGHSLCPPFLPLKTVSCDSEVCILPAKCYVLSYAAFSFFLCPLLEILPPDVWAFKKGQFKRNFFCEASLISPKFRAASPVHILHFQPLYASTIAFILSNYTCPSPPKNIIANINNYSKLGTDSVLGNVFRILLMLL